METVYIFANCILQFLSLSLPFSFLKEEKEHRVFRGLRLTVSRGMDQMDEGIERMEKLLECLQFVRRKKNTEKNKEM